MKTPARLATRLSRGSPRRPFDAQEAGRHDQEIGVREFRMAAKAEDT
jgi:hypothetical protein